MEAIKTRYEEIYARCAETPSWFIHEADRRKTMDVPPEEREAFWEKLYAEPGFGIWMGNFRDILVDETANAAISAFIAKKIRQRVKDPKVADKLIPKDHGFGTRRVPLESGYYEAYNRDNVLLVDLNATPIECITPNGVKTSDRTYIRYSDLCHRFRRRDRRVRSHRYSRPRWGAAERRVADGPRTYLGLAGWISKSADGAWPAYRARQHYPRHRTRRGVADRSAAVHAGKRLHACRNAAGAAWTNWTKTVIKASEPLLSSKINSWQTGVNRNVEGRSVRRVLGYNGNGVHYRRKCEEVANGGYQEFLFRR